MPQPPARAFSQKDLPPSVETAYYRKCIDLRRRINDMEENNDSTRLRITRLNRGIQKMRLERAFLLEQLEKHMEYNVDDSDRSSSPPPTPTDKPLRSKRSHNRKGTPPPTTQTAAAEGAQHPSPTNTHHANLLHQVNPTSSAQSTPDPSRQSNLYFNTIGATATSPHANANGVPTLPPLHSLPALQAQAQSMQPATSTPARGAFFDPAYDEKRSAPAEAAAGRQSAYSGAQQPAATSQPALAEATAPQNRDTEMTDAAFATR